MTWILNRILNVDSDSASHGLGRLCTFLGSWFAFLALAQREQVQGFRRRARWNPNAGHDGILKPRRLCTTAGKEFCMFQRILGKTHSPVQTAVWLVLMMVFLAQGAQKARSGSGKEETTPRRAALGILQSSEQIPGDVPTTPHLPARENRAKAQPETRAQALLDKKSSTVIINPTPAAE